MKPTFSLSFRVPIPIQFAPIQRPLHAAYYRGGTSRAVILNPIDLPLNRGAWPNIFRQVMGSNDPYGRQLDGMGAGVSSLSKICLVEEYINTRPTQPQAAGENPEIGEVKDDDEDPHVDYTFVGMGIEDDEVDTAGSCGNMSSAIGPYAYNNRLLPIHLLNQRHGEITVKIRNTNTNKFIISTFSVSHGQAAVAGDSAIDGVAGTGSPIKLDFRHPYGSKTAKLLPTGNKVDVIHGYKVTCVDGPNPVVFIRASHIGIDGTILPNDLNKLTDKMNILEEIRRKAAVAMGLAENQKEVPRTIPKIGIISGSSTYELISGNTLYSSQMDLAVRFISDRQPHRAIPLTAALTTAIAARIPGTVVEDLLAPEPVTQDHLTIGHPSGRVRINATMDPRDPLVPLSATVYTTAKRLFEGTIFYTGPYQLLRRYRVNESDKGSLGMRFLMESRGQDTSAIPESESSLIGSFAQSLHREEPPMLMPFAKKNLPREPIVLDPGPETPTLVDPGQDLADRVDTSKLTPMDRISLEQGISLMSDKLLTFSRVLARGASNDEIKTFVQSVKSMKRFRGKRRKPRKFGKGTKMRFIDTGKVTVEDMVREQEEDMAKTKKFRERNQGLRLNKKGSLRMMPIKWRGDDRL
ncbi:DUF453-domain-containing protein [Massarina eburnea CBS 473.64]|uniref:DUF453-domain-containing protein n=1 Tax=Massarina eburnea CBS 473.64 TaxID=1395130 RepID=A0A6A6RMT4_9PLEO|nr:DUF453-domain-containing protein [Massarina eburnea CBS 473.64]